jgi:hypothetical protein
MVLEAVVLNMLAGGAEDEQLVGHNGVQQIRAMVPNGCVFA